MNDINQKGASPCGLSFEWDREGEKLEIHGRADDLERLASILRTLSAREANDHIHLMTPEWGGGGLSSEQQNPSSVLINNVKILLWK